MPQGMHFPGRVLFLCIDPTLIEQQLAGVDLAPAAARLASPPTVAASAIAGEIVSFEELQQRFAVAA